MSQIDVSGEVLDLIYPIAVEPVHQSISLEGMRNIVLYCGIGTDIEVRQADGEEVVLEGTKATVGLSSDAARENLARIEIMSDQVEDFFESGPHEGEVFQGTSGGEQSTLSSLTATTRSDWEGHIRLDWSVHGRIEELYPCLKEQVYTLPEEIRKDLRQAARISLLQQKVTDIVMPRQAYTPKLQEVFRANYIGSECVHGPVGSASLVVSVPANRTVTIVGGREVRVSGVRASVNLVGAKNVELADIEGNAYLFDSPLSSARRITGKLCQRFHRYGGSFFAGQPATGFRRGYYESQIEKVDGEVDLEVGRVELDLADLSGRVRIDNDYGTIRLSQSDFEEGSRFWLRTRSGEIRLFLKKDLVEEVNVTINTLCGEVKCAGLKGMNSRSTPGLATLSSVHSPQDADLLEADFYIQTESGSATIEGVR